MFIKQNSHLPDVFLCRLSMHKYSCHKERSNHDHFWHFAPPPRVAKSSSCELGFLHLPKWACVICRRGVKKVVQVCVRMIQSILGLGAVGLSHAQPNRRRHHSLTAKRVGKICSILKTRLLQLDYGPLFGEVTIISKTNLNAMYRRLSWS